MAYPRSGAKRIDVSKVVFYSLLTLTIAGGSFAIGARAGAGNTPFYRFVTGVTRHISDSLTVLVGEASTLFGTHPSHFTQTARYAGDGVTVNDPASDQGDFILLSGFIKDTNELRLIRRSGEIVTRWPVRYYDLFSAPDYFPEGFAPATNWNIDLHGALALPDGSVVFTFEWGGLVKLDRCGKVVWTVRLQTHHSVERAEGGGFWVGGRRFVQETSSYPPFEVPYHEDTLMKIGDNGRIEADHSAVQLLYDNGLDALLTATGQPMHAGMPWNREIVHLNKIEELTSDIAADFPQFAAGDLALSYRDQNLIAVVDPKTMRVKWWKVGSWIRQHDPEFKAGGTIVVFNNNAHHTAFGDHYGTYKVPMFTPPVTNIVEINPASGETRVVYGQTPGQELLSIIKGKVDLTDSGGLLITEAQGGRVRETDATGRLLWEYVNRYDEDEIAELGEARVYRSNYFTVKDWSCS